METPVLNLYQPLDPKTDIRLLIVEKGSGTDPIRCRLVWASFGRKPFYEALSYAWGDPSGKRIIRIENHELEIRTNLWHALHTFRTKRRSRILWVDALCINQRNVKERNHHVGLMKQIYTNAAEVLVWLGVASEDSHLAMRYLKMLLEPRVAWIPIDKESSTALKALCNRDYWQRMWILQEVSLAKSLTVYCGEDRVDWRAFVNLYS